MRAVDLFCGAGGSSLGAAAAGVEIVAGFDIWPVAAWVYAANFPRARFHLCDLAILVESDIRVMRDDLGPVDLLLASPHVLITVRHAALSRRRRRVWISRGACGRLLGCSSRAGLSLRMSSRCAGGVATARSCMP